MSTLLQLQLQRSLNEIEDHVRRSRIPTGNRTKRQHKGPDEATAGEGPEQKIGPFGRSKGNQVPRLDRLDQQVRLPVEKVENAVSS